MTPSPPIAHRHEQFSIPLFALTITASFAGALVLLWRLAPGVWDAQILPPLWRLGAAFVALSFVVCFVEYFFHRYVLHTPAIPFLRRLYRQHTLHHALTRIVRKPIRDGQGILTIENKFPIIEEEQHEAAFFPWYSMAVFTVLLSPLFALLHFALPGFPWFLAGFAAVASSLSLYEVLHAVNHWPLEQWEPLITHARWGWFWQPVYGFHLRHHAVIDCNESISGFFGLPVADWVLGTCVIPKTVYAEGEEWAPEKFRSPVPCALVRKLDTWAQAAVQRHRASAAARSGDAAAVRTESARRVYSRGEEIANWLTHGVGALLSVTALTLLIVFSSLRGEAWHVVSFTVFGVTLLLLYTISTLYHTRRSEWGRKLFRRLNHAAIFLVIAGTYTPFLLTNLRGPWGWTLFGTIWGICGAGAVFRVLSGERYRRFATLAYVISGWLVALAFKALVTSVPNGALWLLLAGGVSYLVGVGFYSWHQVRYHNAVRHIFVLGGSACHFFAVLLFLLPRAG
ncbi:MAG TPA: hemolysin III family protein [Candidatus Didemnitutus sp.]|jgi:hemolysin III